MTWNDYSPENKMTVRLHGLRLYCSECGWHRYVYEDAELFEESYTIALDTHPEDCLGEEDSDFL